jgi:putative heme-binding domain-containing protein
MCGDDASQEWYQAQVRALVTPFLGRQGGDIVLASGLSDKKLDDTTVAYIRGTVVAAGRQSAVLDKLLPQGAKNTVGIPLYSESYIKTLSIAVSAHGDAVRGAKVYASNAMSCAACHKIDDKGGLLGPDLTAIGAGMSAELIIESIVWPRRQVKEGYLSTTLTTKDGGVISGYVASEDRSKIIIRQTSDGLRK